MQPLTPGGTNFIEDPYMMLNYKYEGLPPCGFRQEDFLRFVNFRAFGPKKVGYTDPR